MYNPDDASAETKDEQQDLDLGEVVADYWRSVAAYREFSTLVSKGLGAFKEERRVRIQEEHARVLQSFLEVASKEEGQQLLVLLGLVARSTEEVEENGRTVVEDNRISVGDVSTELSPRSAAAFMRIMKVFEGSATADHHERILFRGILTGLVGQFEVLVADLAHQLFRKAPAATGSADKALTVAELLSFGSIDDAIEHVIADRIDDLLRGSTEDWRKFFESRMNINLPSLAKDWDEFTEFIQRRHLIVHAGGKVSRRYLRIVPQRVVEKHFIAPRVGDEATLNKEYVADAIDAFQVTGLLLGVSAWAKIDKETARDRASLLDEIIYGAIRERRWAIVAQLAQWGQAQDEFDAGTRLICQMNHWLAMKRLGRFGEVQAEVERLDTSVIKPVYSLVRLALLDRNDKFFALVDETNGNALDEQAWDEWPILDEMRQDARFEQLKQKYSPRRPLASMKEVGSTVETVKQLPQEVVREAEQAVAERDERRVGVDERNAQAPSQPDAHQSTPDQ